MKRKRADPRFSNQGGQQQQPGSSNQQSFRQRGGRGPQRGKQQSKGKGKGRGQPQGHSHIASVAALPAPTTSTVLHIGSSSLSKRVVTQDPPSQRTPGIYPSLNNALSLAECLEVTPTIQTTKTLEQRFADFDCEVFSRSDWNLDEEYDSEVDVDMSQPGPSRIKPQTVSELDDNYSESALASAFDMLSVNSYDSNSENRAPTPEYCDPMGVEVECISSQWPPSNL